MAKISENRHGELLIIIGESMVKIMKFSPEWETTKTPGKPGNRETSCRDSDSHPQGHRLLPGIHGLEGYGCGCF